MKQSGVLVLVIFVAAVSFVVASEQFKTERTKTTLLNGTNEVDSIGDSDGSGILKFAVKAEEGKFCYDLTVNNISVVTTATLNVGARGTNGSAVATLQPPLKGSSSDCITLESDRLGDIIRTPTNYYVNIQNQEFPNGAIRGQLK